MDDFSIRLLIGNINSYKNMSRKQLENIRTILSTPMLKTDSRLKKACLKTKNVHLSPSQNLNNVHRPQLT